MAIPFGQGGGGGGGAVTSVAGKTGDVVLVEADITDLSHPVTSVAGKTGVVTLVEADITDLNHPVDSVAGKTGVVTLVENDITDLGAYITDAPSDGSQYARKDAAWAVVTAPAPTLEWLWVDLNGNNQTGLVTDVVTRINFTNVEVDTQSNWSGASNYYYVPDAGIYEATVLAMIGTGDGDQVNVGIRKNGTLICFQSLFPGAASSPSCTCTKIVQMNGTDTLDATAFQSSGSNQIIRGEVERTYLQVKKIG